MARPLHHELAVLDNEVETTWNISAAQKAAIDDQQNHYNSILRNRPEKVRPSANVYGPPMHRNPRSTIRPSDRMNKLFKIASEIAPQVQARDQFQTLMSIFDGANALKLLHRFVDRTQPIMKRQYEDDIDIMTKAVNPAQRKQFDHELRLRKIFIRLLHVGGLTSFVGPGLPMNDTYLRSFGRIYRNARLLLEEEVSRIIPSVSTDSYDTHDAYGDPAAASFAWVTPARST